MKSSANNKNYCSKVKKAVQWLRKTVVSWQSITGHIIKTCFHFGTSRTIHFLKTAAVPERKNFLQWYTPFFLLYDPYSSVKHSTHWEHWKLEKSLFPIVYSYLLLFSPIFHYFTICFLKQIWLLYSWLTYFVDRSHISLS